MADTKVYSGPTVAVRPLAPPEREVLLKSLADVEELLNWLERAGYDFRVTAVGDEFVLRWWRAAPG